MRGGVQRQWHVHLLATVRELSEEHLAKFVRVLDEGLVLFLDTPVAWVSLLISAGYRCAFVVYGQAEARGISFADHG